MCGRFVLCINHFKLTEDDLGFSFDIDEPAYNIAPTNSIFVIFEDEANQFKATKMRWGLIPSWWKDAKMPSATFNARSETVSEKPSFREAFKKRRCLIPASGFYEWQKSGSKKVPHYFSSRDGLGFAFAGIWEQWKREDDTTISSCSIIVGPANKLVEPIHDRMAVILPPKAFASWLNPKEDLNIAKSFLAPYDETKMQVWQVSEAVNKVSASGPELIKAVRE